MKAVKVTAPAHLALFLVAKAVPFVYDPSEEAYYITNTANPDKFKAFCAKNGVRERDINEMAFSPVVLDCSNIPTEINN